MKEQWKPFAGGNYEASNHGRVRRKTPGRTTVAGRVLKLYVMKITTHFTMRIVLRECGHCQMSQSG
jgi:hypothetical protein